MWKKLPYFFALVEGVSMNEGQRTRRASKQQPSEASEARGTYRSPSIGEIFSRLRGSDVPEGLRQTAVDTASKKDKRVLLELFDERIRFTTEAEVYDAYVVKLKKVKYSLSDIRDFVDMFRYDPEKISAGDAGTFGLFISAAANKVIKDGDTLNLDFSGHYIHEFVGYGLSKGTLILVGAQGSYTGTKMSGGRIILDAAGILVGQLMTGGEILIEGSAGQWLGQGMRGGKIEVREGVQGRIADGMAGGEIRIEGQKGKMFLDKDRKGGMIFVDGREII
jgi:hypothetical protein